MTIHRGRGFASINYPIGMNLGGDPSQALVHSNPGGKFMVALSSIVSCVGVVVLLLGLDWRLALAAFVVLPPLIAGTVLFLCSDGARSVTGQTIAITGGEQ